MPQISVVLIKLPGMTGVPAMNQPKKLVRYTARLFFMHAYVPTQPLTLIFIWMIKVPVTLVTGLMY
ncbi:MAG TPA: hypothetical protein DCS73_00330 [Roseburia sp.]|nr:hypothetical protein [Roseburia sp.]